MFFFLINFDIFQIQTKSNKAWPSSLQAEVTLAGRLSEHKQKEIKDSSAYFAASWAAAFPLLFTQKKKNMNQKILPKTKY